MPLKESGEMYLESIYILCKSRPSVRSIDIAEYMKFSKPSVSRGMRLLKNAGYIIVDQDGFITLTADGKKTAENIFERHTILTNILIKVGVDEQTAAEDACRIEHVISEKSFNALKNLIK